MVKHSIAAIALWAFAFLMTFAPAHAERRVALVIGNAAYEHVPPLVNPSNDATDIAAKLRGLNFDVIEGIDLGKRDMEKKIRGFAEALTRADVALFYYAGHGLQVEQRNYLAPVDAELRAESDLDFEAVELDLVLKNMLRNASTSIVFLDACRDNPLAKNLSVSSRSVDIGRGLARIDAASSMMVVYSAESGKVALDGTGRNSPFTEALLRHIDTEGESIGDMMIDVRNDVLKATNGQQRPFESASLTGQFFFKPKPEQPTVSASGTNSGSSTDSEIAALRDEITKLQTDQGALLKSQQEQLEALQKKLAEETTSPEASGGAKPPSSSVELASPQPSEVASGARQIAVEPASSSDGEPPSASAEPAKVAAAEPASSSEPTKTPASEAGPSLPSGASDAELAQDMLVELKRIGCYFGDPEDGWTGRGQAALIRFNRLSNLGLSVEEPAQASLDALKSWSGGHCPVEKASTPRVKASRQAPPVAAGPRKQVKTASPRSAPHTPPHFEPLPPRQSAGGGDEQRELQRAFPSAAWPSR